MIYGKLLDFLGQKRLSDKKYARYITSSYVENPYIVYRGARYLWKKGHHELAKRTVKKHLDMKPDARLTRLYAFFLLKERKEELAIKLYHRYIKIQPDNLWARIFLGDLYYFFVNEKDKGIEIWEEILNMEEEITKSTIDPARYVYKRLTKVYMEREDIDKALELYEKFLALTPSNFYETDFINLATIYLIKGMEEKAKHVMEMGIAVSPKYYKLRQMYEDIFGVKIKAREHKWVAEVKQKYPDIEKIPIKTKIVDERDEIWEIADLYTRNIRQEGDIIVIASCVAAITEGMFYMADGVDYGTLAWLLASFVEKKNPFHSLKEHHGEPFSLLAPLANPMAMQVLIEETGTLPIIKAAIHGAIGRLTGKRGMFYKTAGDQAALIDDMPASLAPYDYYIILGPEDSDAVAMQIKEITGLEAAIVDANDLTGAWVVGASDGVDRKLLEDVLMDNPAGNQDQQTPVMLVRGL